MRRISIPNNPPTIFTMKKERRTIISPTTAKVNLCLELTTFCLSPPDVIISIPPEIKKKSDKRIDTTIRDVTPHRTRADSEKM